MKCEICNKNRATIQIHFVTDNNKRHFAICESCALVTGIMGKKGDEKEISISNLLSGVFEAALKKSFFKEKRCPVCGKGLGEILKDQKCGCSSCYSVYQKEIRRKLKQCYGHTRHHGKYPERLLLMKRYLFDIRELKEKLKIAVRNEDYEKAAELRDRIMSFQDTGRE
ncbi:MAG: UvrB/UvrC motif-containing protein [Spirochaetales bacterium]|nr:UvrB/UvrC motif-containing protein [Spirochaetales bacterium]